MLLVTPSGHERARATGVPLPGTSAPELTEAGHTAFGQNVWLLHDGGVGMGRRDFPARFEALDAVTGAGVPVAAIAGARPWQQPGWRGEVLAWLESLLGERVQDLSWVSNSDLAAVLCVQTASGKDYLKTDDGREARATAQLAAQLPGDVPKVLAADLKRGWLLTRDAGSRLLESGQPNHWLSAVRKLASMHREVRLTGVPTHRFADLPEQWNALISPAGLGHWDLSEQDQTHILGLLPRVLRLHRETTALLLPEVACHGDVHANNALVQGDSVRLFDFSEAGLAHPFTDIGWFLAFAMHPGREVAARRSHPDLGERLWSAYRAASGIRTDLTWRDAALLALFCRAVVYDARYRDWTGTLPGFRPQYVPYVLRIARLFGPAATPGAALS